MGRSGEENRNQGERGVRWCEGRSGTENRTPLDLLVTVEEACATTIFNQLPGADKAQAQEEREENADKHID